MRSIYELRKVDNPPLNGVEALEMVLSSQLTAKEEHNVWLSDWLKELGEKKSKNESKARLMIIGSVIDKSEVIELIESQGGIVVTDELCTGTRYFWDDVDENDEPLAALARRYLDKVNCSCMIAGDRRFKHIEKMMSQFNVQGAVIVHQKFCTPHGNDYPYLKQWFTEKGIPHLLLEIDIPTPGGQIKNRVQTLVEMLESELI